MRSASGLQFELRQVSVLISTTIISRKFYSFLITRLVWRQARLISVTERFRRRTPAYGQHRHHRNFYCLLGAHHSARTLVGCIAAVGDGRTDPRTLPPPPGLGASVANWRAAATLARAARACRPALKSAPLIVLCKANRASGTDAQRVRRYMSSVVVVRL